MYRCFGPWNSFRTLCTVLSVLRISARSKEACDSLLSLEEWISGMAGLRPETSRPVDQSLGKWSGKPKDGGLDLTLLLEFATLDLAGRKRISWECPSDLSQQQFSKSLRHTMAPRGHWLALVPQCDAWKVRLAVVLLFFQRPLAQQKRKLYIGCLPNWIRFMFPSRQQGRKMLIMQSASATQRCTMQKPGSAKRKMMRIEHGVQERGPDF